MIDNYRINDDGVIEQIVKHNFLYDKSYGDRYFNFGNDIENIRLGYIIGSIGYVPESLMDIGYGNGSFLINCKNFIKNLYGNDIEPVYKLSNDIKFIQNVFEVEVEVITFFDSLEHFHNIEFVKNLNCRYVVISLPCCYNGEDDDWFTNWKHRKPNEHLFHFNSSSLEKFMNRQGFEMINHCNIEDKIRIDKNLFPNILTACFKKII